MILGTYAVGTFGSGTFKILYGDPCASGPRAESSLEQRKAGQEKRLGQMNGSWCFKIVLIVLASIPGIL